MPIKLVALDVDGTLLDPDHQLTEPTRLTIQRVMARGVKVILATGRQYSGLKSLLRILDLNDPQITTHGAVTVEPHTGHILEEFRLPRKQTEQVIDLGQQLGVTITLAHEGRMYSVANNADTDYMQSYGDLPPIIVPALKPLLNDFLPPAIVATAYARDDVYETADRVFREYLAGQINIYRTSPYFIEFVSTEASKGNALARICDHLGIRAEEVMAVGDSHNDISMLQFAGLGVAMGHSDDIVQAAANEVTLANDQDGVAYILKHHILNTPY